MRIFQKGRSLTAIIGEVNQKISNLGFLELLDSFLNVRLESIVVIGFE